MALAGCIYNIPSWQVDDEFWKGWLHVAASIEPKWHALRRIANSYRIQAWLVIVVGAVLLLGIVFAWAGQPPGTQSTPALFISGLGPLILAAVIVLVTSAIATVLFGNAELIELMIAIEENTRMTAMNGFQSNVPLATAPAVSSSTAPSIWPAELP